jgi:two-component system, cell cycle response regulator
MSDRRPGGFGEDTNATPLVRLSDASVVGPKRPCLIMIAGPLLGEIFPIESELLIGRDPEAQLRLAEDESLSRQHAKVKPLAEGALITDLGSANGTYVDGQKINECVLKEGAKIRVGQTVVLKFARYDSIEEAAQRQLLEAALRDGLTHTFNRRYFTQRLAAEMRFAERHAQGVSLVMLDIDHFKDINDTHGHPMGDQILRRLGELLHETLRAEDVLARYGGEEFAVLARGTTKENAVHLAERLCRLVAGAHFGPKDKPIKVTLSAGVATYPFTGEKPADISSHLIELADAALYRAKQAGRNRVES